MQAEFSRDIRLGDYFMFISKRRHRIKITWWDRDGLAIFMKRRKAGTIQRLENANNEKSLFIDQAQLTMRLSGSHQLLYRQTHILTALQSHDGRATPNKIATLYARANKSDVGPLLETLASVGNVRRLDDGGYAMYR